jgi:hypothetical protein
MEIRIGIPILAVYALEYFFFVYCFYALVVIGVGLLILCK